MANVIDLAQWMKLLDDGISLLNITWPGTHDSGSKDITFAKRDFAQTQDLNVLDQLTAGIRFLDIRVKLLPSGTFQVVHGTGWKQADCHLGFNYEYDGRLSVLDSCKTFLGNNSSECIIMSVKDEDGVGTEAFDTALKKAIGPGGPGTSWYTGQTLPATLGAVRGQIVLVRRWASYGPTPYGIDASPTAWPSKPATNPFVVSNLLSVQDVWSVSSIGTTAINQKWPLVKAQLDLAATAPPEQYLFVNFASANGSTGSANPRNIAEGINGVEGILARLQDYLRDNPHGNRLGAVLLDFAGSSKAQDLIKLMVERNVEPDWPQSNTTNGIDKTWENVASCVYGDRLWAFWKGTNDAGTIFMTSSADGKTWPIGTCPNTSNASYYGPSACVFKDRIFLVWRGPDPDNAVMFTSWNGGAWATGQPLKPADPSVRPPQSKWAPAVCATDTKIFVFWAEKSGGLFVLESTDGVVWKNYAQVMMLPVAAPSACIMDNVPYVFCPERGNIIKYQYQGQDGGWKFGTENYINTSPTAVTACQFGKEFYVFWQANDSSNRLYFAMMGKIFFSDGTTINGIDSTDHAPTSVVFKDSLYLIFKSNDWGNCLRVTYSDRETRVIPKPVGTGVSSAGS